jgi:thiamine pyrophosphokinase
MKKKAAIFLNGSLDSGFDLNQYIDKETMIICADGGAVHALDRGLVPDVLIGDLDSIPKTYLEQVQKFKTKIISFPKKKDYTDGELSMKYALDHTIDDILIFAFKGSRFDHVLSNILFISKFAHQADFTLIDKDETSYYVRDKIVLKGKIGDTVSLIAVGETCNGIKTQGLEYPLNDESLPLGITRGVSNILKNEKAQITIQSGILLIIHEKNI